MYLFPLAICKILASALKPFLLREWTLYRRKRLPKNSRYWKTPKFSLSASYVVWTSWRMLGGWRNLGLEPFNPLLLIHRQRDYQYQPNLNLKRQKNRGPLQFLIPPSFPTSPPPHEDLHATSFPGPSPLPVTVSCQMRNIVSCLRTKTRVTCQPSRIERIRSRQLPSIFLLLLYSKYSSAWKKEENHATVSSPCKFPITIRPRLWSANFGEGGKE